MICAAVTVTILATALSMLSDVAKVGLAVLTGAGGAFSIKLEDQVLITEDGHENLTHFPFDAPLMGEG